MERTEDDGDPPRIDVERFVDVYRWINENLEDEVAIRIDQFVDEDLPRSYPADVAPVYQALARDEDNRLRTIAAIGLHHVFRHAPEEAARLAAQLLDDQDEAVAAQARQTLRDLPELLTELDRQEV